MLPVELKWQASPDADTQISVFRELAGKVARTLVSTGSDVRAEIPLHEDGGRYLLNGVHLEPASGDGPAWVRQAKGGARNAPCARDQR